MKKLKKLHITTVFFVLLMLVFVWWINNYTLSVNHAEIKSDLVNDEITIVHLTDLHGATFGKENKTLIDRVSAQAPDLVAITGDMFTYESESGKQTAFKLLEALAERFPTYYVNGEHDDDEDFFNLLRENGVNVINYKDEVITVKNTKLHLYGIDNVYFPPHFDLENAFKKDEATFSILLSHMPEFERFHPFGIELVLSGDTHGGLFRLPFVGAVFDGKTALPDMNGRFVKGLYEVNGQYIHVSGGLGTYPVPARLWNRPEIAVIKLQPDK
ncbi:MAG: metallophosphoesterase [Clostridia bacterium]|nr:metallophosphoesterase [Clostridia bacterium]